MTKKPVAKWIPPVENLGFSIGRKKDEKAKLAPKVKVGTRKAYKQMVTGALVPSVESYPVMDEETLLSRTKQELAAEVARLQLIVRQLAVVLNLAPNDAGHVGFGFNPTLEARQVLVQHQTKPAFTKSDDIKEF